MLSTIVIFKQIQAKYHFIINIIHIWNCFNIYLDFEYHGNPYIPLVSITIE